MFNETAFKEMLTVLDGAINLADSAVKAAEATTAYRPEPVVTLEKVAFVRCDVVARELLKTGAFKGLTQSDLANCLHQSDKEGLVELLEKLASRAVFPIDADFFGSAGDLVDKPSTYRADSGTHESKAELWARISDEVGLG